MKLCGLLLCLQELTIRSWTYNRIKNRILAPFHQMAKLCYNVFRILF